MPQLSDDCFAFGGTLMTTAEALTQLDHRLEAITATETVPIGDATERILAVDIVSSRSVPPHDNAAVDGYAVFFDDLSQQSDTRLPIAGRVSAGHPLSGPAQCGNAYRIFTGAPMPLGTDSVLMQEDCRIDGDGVIIPPGIKQGANRRFAGEDIQAGTTILKAGRRLRPQDLGLAASIGQTRI
jgi:molybdopterin molybdotransferase